VTGRSLWEEVESAARRALTATEQTAAGLDVRRPTLNVPSPQHYFHVIAAARTVFSPLSLLLLVPRGLDAVVVLDCAGNAPYQSNIANMSLPPNCKVIPDPALSPSGL
jgi:hypothetical protein